MMHKPNKVLSKNIAKKIVLLLCISPFASVQIFAQTNVSGLISSNTVWTSASSPYVVTGNVLVNTGVTLTIEPGVIIKFDSLKALQIDGQLIARGTNSRYITFTSNKSAPVGGYWGFIFFSDASTDAVFDASGNYTSGSILERCIVEYVGGATGNYGAVEMTNAHPFIKNCIIRNNNKSGIYARNLTALLAISNCAIHDNTRSCSNQDGGGGVYASGGTVIIANNTINDNTVTTGQGGGIYIKDCKAIIANNTISNNVATWCGGAVFGEGCTAAITNNTISGNTAVISGTGLEDGVYMLSGTATISNNIISKNAGGIMIYAGGASITNNIICGNTAPYGGGGISIRGAAATISQNVISDNATSEDYASGGNGGGICIYDYYSWSSSYSVTITKNSITNNSARNASAVEYDIPFAGLSNEDFAHNTISGNAATNSAPTYTTRISYHPVFSFNNILANVATYELSNSNGNGTPNLNAKNNWWGTSVDAQVQERIHDWFDDASLGLVDYSPYLSAPDIVAPISPPANVIKTQIGGGQLRITWSRNPEADVAGYRVYYGSFNGYSFANSVDVRNDTSCIISGVAFYDTVGVTAYDRTYSISNENDSTIVNDNMTNGSESWYAYAMQNPAQTQWAAQNSGTNDELDGVFFTDANTGYAVGSDTTTHNGLVLKTTSGGRSWIPLNVSCGMPQSVYFTDANTGYIAAYDTILKTTNAGASWSKSPISMGLVLFNVHFYNSDVGYAAGMTWPANIWTILKTTNAGNTWTARTIPTGQHYRPSSLFCTGVNICYFAGGDARRTTDGGTTWNSMSTPSNSDWSSVYFTSTVNGVMVGGNNSSGTIIRTTDGGTSWKSVYSAASFLSSVSFADADLGFAVGVHGTMLKTTDGGATWAPQTSPTGNRLNSVHFPAANTGYAVGDNGTILAYGGPTTGVTQGRTSLPARFLLSQNYPNPFNPSTTIQYDLPKPGHLSIVVYNTLGQVVDRLVDGHQNAGTYRVKWNASNVPSGVYFYRLVGPGFSDIKKMILLR